MRIIVFTAMVVNALLSGLEEMFSSKGQLWQLERFQNKCLVKFIKAYSNIIIHDHVKLLALPEIRER